MERKCYPTPYVFNVTAINSALERRFGENDSHHHYSGIRRDSGGFEYPGEMHNFWEAVYVEKGKITVSEDERIYEVGEGCVIFHAPMEFHRYRAEREDFPVSIKIFSFTLDTNIQHKLSKGLFVLDIAQKEKMAELFQMMISKYKSGYWIETEDASVGGADEMWTVKMLEEFLLELSVKNDPDRTQNSSMGAKRYKEVIKVLKENVHENLTIEDVSKLSHLSISYIKKLFSLYAGCGVMQYFNRLKMVKAMKYLDEGKMVGEVSDMLGFSGPNYFSVAFKKETGVAPNVYKRK